MKITLKEISRNCHLSPSTVSRVLSNKTHHTENYLKIAEAIKSIQIRDGSDLLGSLRNRYRPLKRICLLSFSAELESQGVAFNEILQGIKMAANAGSHLVFQVASNGTYEKDGLIERAIHAASIDGVVGVGLADNDENIAFLSTKSLPCLLVNRHPRNNTSSFVSLDNRAGAEMAIDYLSERGCSRFLILAADVQNSCFEERLAGFKNRIRARGHFLKVGPHFPASNPETWQQEISALVKKERMDAIVTTSDSIAVSAVIAMNRFRIRVPEDVSIMGFDNSPLCESTTPQLSSVDSHLRDMGKVALESVGLLSEHKSVKNVQILLRPDVVARGSTR